jgi:lipopolysaccharide transport system permease protein
MSSTIETLEEPLPAAPPVTPVSDVPVLVIERRSGLRLIDFRELYAYRDLFQFLTWRMIKVRYAQSAIGIGWAIIQPLFTTLVFTVVFGRFAKVDSEGQPYLLFSFAAMVPWTYFANSLTEGTNSLVQSADMISKVYFPRVILPLSAVVAKLLDFAIAFVLLLGLMLWQGVVPNLGVLLLPVLVLLMMATAAGLGMWLTALAIQYRDVKHAMTFLVQLLMYAAPVVYATSAVPSRWELPGGLVVNPQWLYALNPMVGVIEGFRSALLGTRPMPWEFLAIGMVSAAVIFVSGALYFRAKERLFADVA